MAFSKLVMAILMMITVLKKESVSKVVDATQVVLVSRSTPHIALVPHHPHIHATIFINIHLRLHMVIFRALLLMHLLI